MKPKPADLEAAREQLIAQGKDPDDFPKLFGDKDRPKLFRDVEWVWEGFTVLSGSRQLGHGTPQPLLLGEMLSYLDHRGITDPDDREEFIFLIQSIDRRFIAEAIAKAKAHSSPPRPGKPPR